MRSLPVGVPLTTLAEFVNYNKKFLARVYPSPMRIDSSNMNPQDFWKCGCQIVAMNYQTPGLMMDLNIGWFRQNGNCGYVLRPAIMREQVSYFSANTKDSVPGVSPQLLHIKIISGQNFPKPKGSGTKGDVVDPYIYIEIHGIPADCAEQRTKTVHQNGDNPIFDESFEFQINLPELAMVRFVVLDDWLHWRRVYRSVHNSSLNAFSQVSATFPSSRWRAKSFHMPGSSSMWPLLTVVVVANLTKGGFRSARVKRVGSMPLWGYFSSRL